MRLGSLSRLLALSSLLVLLSTGNGFAAELRIIDALGLMRAVSNIEQNASVVIVIAGQPPESLMLTHADGVAPDRSADSADNGVFIFRNVPGGLWRIAAGREVTVAEVRIE